MSSRIWTSTPRLHGRVGGGGGSGEASTSGSHAPPPPPPPPPPPLLLLPASRHPRSISTTTTAVHSYKESRKTVDPLKEIVADPGSAWAGSLTVVTPAAAAAAAPSTSTTTSTSTTPTPHPPPQLWPRALKQSLTAVPTVAFQRLPPSDVAARPSRFPFSGQFSLTLSGGRPPPSPHPPPLTAAAVHAMLVDSGLVDAGRAARIASIAAARTWAVLPVIADSFDRGNLGACCRSAEAFGLGGVWVAAPATERYRPTRGRCSSGAEKWLDVRVFDCKRSCIDALRAHGYRIAVAVGADDGGGSEAPSGRVTPAEAFPWADAPTAIVLGNEGDGVSAEFLAAADARVTIPMAGFVESFNVSVAAALLLSAARRALDRAAAAEVGGEGMLVAPAAAAARLAPDEAEALSAAMLLRHKGKEWQAPFLEALAARAAT